MFKPKENRKVFRVSISAVTGLILYEFSQLFMAGRDFDVKDIIASITGGLFAYALFIFINWIITDKTH